MKKFNYAVVAGTFDHLHAGHLALLKTAKQQSRRLAIGLTGPEFIAQKTLAPLIEPFDLRRQQLKKFLGKFPAKIVSLKDPIGPAATTPFYDAIFASPETMANVNKINYLRRRVSLKPLKTVMIRPVKDTAGKTISSSRIRAGLINREGLAYAQLFKRRLKLPKNQRRHFKSPLGSVMTDKKVVKLIKKQKPILTITVGDIAVMTLIKQGLNPDLAIIDLKTKRQLFVDKPHQLGLRRQVNQVVANPPGTITTALVKALLKSFKKGQLIIVRGEEDLAVLPAILLSPLTTAVIYGQPDQGLVYLTVDEELKAKTTKLIHKFT